MANIQDNTYLMNQLVNKYLNAGFTRGAPLSNDDLESVIGQLGRPSNTFDKLDEDYKEFLNQYGSIGGNWWGQIGAIVPFGNPIESMVQTQRNFQSDCSLSRELNDISIIENSKSCWLIAESEQHFIGDHRDQFYVDLSSFFKDHVYCARFNRGIRYYSKNFVDFLNKYFTDYEVHTEKTRDQDDGNLVSTYWENRLREVRQQQDNSSESESN